MKNRPNQYDDIMRKHFHGFSDEQWNEEKHFFPYSEIPYIIEDVLKTINETKTNQNTNGPSGFGGC